MTTANLPTAAELVAKQCPYANALHIAMQVGDETRRRAGKHELCYQLVRFESLREGELRQVLWRQIRLRIILSSRDEIRCPKASAFTNEICC